MFSKSVDYPGHIIAPSKLQVAKTTTEATESLQFSKDISQMRSSLGLWNVNICFVPGFAKIAAPLSKKLKNGEHSQFVLDDQERRAVNELKHRLVIPPVMAQPRAKGQYTVNTEASDIQIGRVLLQEQNDKVLNPIVYSSKSLCEAERQHNTTQKECLKVVWSVLMLRPC